MRDYGRAADGAQCRGRLKTVPERAKRMFGNGGCAEEFSDGLTLLKAV